MGLLPLNLKSPRRPTIPTAVFMQETAISINHLLGSREQEVVSEGHTASLGAGLLILKLWVKYVVQARKRAQSDAANRTLAAGSARLVCRRTLM
ncbi:hypothetical protein PBY51_013840 [Eleginops maclovinus]|uniref:Uncharacterized protein n=1 Tax=Eleginops maclovinus TaxID=56733 RepID=A0AAN8AXB5_ELEMC|nr:hypothetical protein PBY51_013840 [Eleginops maclovinus]